MIKTKMKPDFDIILFDLGGVLIELSEHAIPTSWLKSKSFNSSDWFQSPTAMQFEKGQISAVEFANALIDELDLEVSSHQVITAFTAWPKGIFPQVPKILNTLKNDYKLAVLSNSNELHWPRILNEFKLSQYMDAMFSSHLIKLAKPDVLAFEHVLDSMTVSPEKVLFFDDNPLNISAAKKLGIESILVNNALEIESYFAL